MARADLALAASVTSLVHWSTLHDAWHDATLACPRDAVGPKEPLPINVIIAIVEHRVRANSALRDALDLQPSLRQRIADLRSHLRDAQGRNWDIPASDVGTLTCHGDEAEIRRVLDALRDQFDLA